MSNPQPLLGVEVVDDSLVLTGELDAHTAALLAQHLATAGALPRLELDLAGVTFMDSTGLRHVLGEHQARERDGRRLVIRRPSAPVIRLIELTGLGPHLHVDLPLEG